MANKKVEKIEWQKVETIEEFLSRGGTITIIEPEEIEEEENTPIRVSNSVDVNKLSLGESEIAFGEKRKKKKKEKVLPTAEQFNTLLQKALSGQCIKTDLKNIEKKEIMDGN